MNITHNHKSHNANYTSNFTADDLKVHWAYIIISVFNFSVLVFFLIVYCFRPITKEYPCDLSNESTPQKSNTLEKERSIKENSYVKTEKSLEIAKSEMINEKIQHQQSDIPFQQFLLIKPLSLGMKILIWSLSILFFHLYCGLEISFGSLLSPFAVKSNIKMTKSEGSYLTSTYWGMFTFFRIVSLFAITYFSPRCILIFSMVLIMLSNVFLLPFANYYSWALWVSSD